MLKSVKFKLFGIQKRIDFKKSRLIQGSSQMMLQTQSYCAVLLPQALIVKHTRRNKKLKAVNKMCLKLCLGWSSPWLLLSLESSCIDCAHWPPASSSRVDLLRKAERGCHCCSLMVLNRDRAPE